MLKIGMSSEIVHKNIKVSGRVQGVGFRYSAKMAAENLGLKGYVENLYDGDVYLEVEGTAENVNEFINWCRTGPGYASVDQVYIGDDAVKSFRSFEIRH